MVRINVDRESCYLLTVIRLKNLIATQSDKLHWLSVLNVLGLILTPKIFMNE